MPSSVAALRRRARAPGVMSLPASAKRNWISRNMRRISGCAWQTAAQPRPSPRRGRTPGCLPLRELARWPACTCASFSRSARITPRAASISRSVTRPSALATMPHQAEGAEEELLAQRARPAARCADIVLVAERGTSRRAPGTQRHARAAPPISFPVHCISFIVPSLKPSSSTAVCRNAACRPRTVTSRQGPRCLRHRRGQPADHRHRSPVGLRRDPAGPDSGQGPHPHRDFEFLVRAHRHIIRNHLLDRQLHAVLTDPAERAQAEGRSMIARRLKALPIEAVVRGYLIGSGWKDYQATAQGLRHRAAGGPAAGTAAAGGHLHAGHQGRRGRSR